MQINTSRLEALCRWAQKLGPYVMLEILLPGGTLMALLLFLYQRRSTVLAPALASVASVALASSTDVARRALRHPLDHTTIRSAP